MESFAVPEIVRRRAEALGPAGTDWLRDLPAVVGALRRRWGLELGEVLTGATAALVLRAVTAGGTDVVLKVAVPDPGFGRQARTLVDADGRGHVRVLDADLGRGAVLLEALGPSLDRLGRTPERQITDLCDLLGVARKLSRLSGPAGVISRLRCPPVSLGG